VYALVQCAASATILKPRQMPLPEYRQLLLNQRKRQRIVAR
jgi:hypothetical protein